MVHHYTALMDTAFKARGNKYWRDVLRIACFAFVLLGCGGHQFHGRTASCGAKGAVIDTTYWTPALQDDIRAGLEKGGTALPDGYVNRIIEKLNRVVTDHAEAQRAVCDKTFAAENPKTAPYDQIQACLSLHMEVHRLLASYLTSRPSDGLMDNPEHLAWLVDGILLGTDGCRYESEYGLYPDAAPGAAAHMEFEKLRHEWAELTMYSSMKRKLPTTKKSQPSTATESHTVVLYMRFLIALQQAVTEMRDEQFDSVKKKVAIIQQLTEKIGDERLKIHAMTMQASTALYDQEYLEYKKINMEALQAYLSLTGSQQDGSRDAAYFRMLGGLAESAGDYGRAVDVRTAAVSYYKEQLGDDSILLAWEYFWLANCLRELNRHDASAQAYNNALDRMKRLLGPDAESVGFVYGALSHEYTAMNKPERALSLREKALQIELKNADEPGESQITDCIRLAEDYRDQSNHVKALEMYNLALGLRTKLTGAKNLNAATIYFEIGRVHTEVSDFENAFRMFTQALEIQKELSGPNSDAPAYTLEEIELLCQSGYNPACELIQEEVAPQQEEVAPQTEPEKEQP